MYASLPEWVREVLPIVVLLGVIAVVVKALPRIDVGHSAAFRRRRFFNWFPVGMTYAFLYMARYNLTAFKDAVRMSHDSYGTIDLVGAVVYGCSFILNGPLTDKIGGRKTILISALGAAACNVAMGIAGSGGWDVSKTTLFSVLYAANMYFQSFGAVSIVKLNAPWFHLRERGSFGGIFGILISLGLWFAYDWAPLITRHLRAHWAFLVPPIVLVGLSAVNFFVVRDTPAEAGHPDFETADASLAEPGTTLGVIEVAKRMFTNPVILTIAAVEFCSGFLRNAIMKWYQPYAHAIGIADSFVPSNWGMLLCCAGILGGVFAGFISDHGFGSRRGPVASILYGGMLVGCGVMFVTVTSPAFGWVVVLMSLCIIGVHGMLSGTASMDFGGKKNVGTAVGIIDGFVYLGTGAQALTLKRLLPDGEAGGDPANWSVWPVAMLPFAVIGLLLATRVWNARPQTRTAAR